MGSYYVPSIPVQPQPLLDSTGYHTPYVRDPASLALDAQHDVRSAEDRARVQELARYSAIQANRATGLTEQHAGNRTLDEQIAIQRSRVAAAAADAYSPKGPFLNSPPSSTHRPVGYAVSPGL
eukprot:TRINITY_DN187_c0_g2_i1.p1 TRINITY_DN187_c0_g2~~TRINITY_DN187_c0_g2_i1.p1  ORF type:complete len:141 (+),score=31.65 TRINITY_DN187_c0_g2_i1:55-423(+)